MSLDIVRELRQLMAQQQVDALIIPTSDTHKSEYIVDYWKIREWLTGFSGSAGTAVITNQNADLWTDSRYFVQAKNELKEPFKLFKLKTRGHEYIDWLCKELKPGDRIGINPELFSLSEIKNFETKLSKRGISLKLQNDIFDSLWKNRPIPQTNQIYTHSIEFNDLSRIDKINKVKSYLIETNADQILVSALDDIAWLLNLRGSDVNYNPVFRSFVLIQPNTTVLFVDQEKLNSDLKNELINNGILIKDYQLIDKYLSEISNNSTIEIDGNSANYKLINSMPAGIKIIESASMVGKLKAIKTDAEISHYKNAQIRDGVAMCNFLHWLEDSVSKDFITEVDAAMKSEEFRSVQNNYMQLSFETISAYAENAALPHYSCNNENPVLLKTEGLYLIDSGAQYTDGTTDITRTIALGKVTNEEITNFTLVLKGHIRVATAKFPYGTKGFHIDTLARLDLWQQGKDFGHGTGHGIGYFLNVHEGPQGFSQSQNGSAASILEPGMLITNEPGIYVEGKHGIRIENVLVCKEDLKTEMGQFLSFDTLSYCPIDKNLIAVKLLNNLEIDWVNNYHNEVYELISPHVSEKLLEWLKAKTSPLDRSN
ncbi:MAG: aminopeptidase P family protein [Salinivirgaceae bacterium]|jgi:Xaa-Pro aminopeptidase|nr:aminopeptidase P family protein [Salinivirgaceae bacterium]